jgi:hypothetical protein
MNVFYRFTSLFVFFLLIFKTGYCQEEKKNVYQGKVRGVVRDSVHNHILELASAAIYKVKDSALISYQLSNAFGEFQFKEIPEDTQLKIIISYTGYKTVSRKFTIPGKNGAVDLGRFNLERGVIELNEVTIRYVPPVRMNGDTLEFNASAFDMDKNAVAEDLLRKLPRLTVWGDGTITVNGKNVKQLLVNGKPFFGGDTRVAIQNIPKDAIDKIQVYKDQQNKRNPLDSVTSMNIKLKKHKQNALFGKLSLGYGTDRTYESDANINLLMKNTQISVVGAKNNINKSAEDANTLLRNSTYKGVGASIDYQPDFRLPGINKSGAAGLVLQHDFVPDVNYNNASRLIGDYFIKDNTSIVRNELQTITTLAPDSTQRQQNNNWSETASTGQKLRLNYERRKSDLALKTSVSVNRITTDMQSAGQISLYGSAGRLQSSNISDIESRMTDKNLTFGVDIRKQKDFAKINRLPGDWGINYVFDAGNKYTDNAARTAFTSESSSVENKNIDRQNSRTENYSRQHLSMDLGDFSGLMFGSKGLLGINFLLKNSLTLNSKYEDDIVKNRNITGVYQIGPYLTNSSRLSEYDDQIALDIGKTFLRDLPNRYQKLLSFGLTVQEQLYYQKNISDHSFQNLTRNYQKFVPEASVTYTNDQYGEFTDNYSLSFNTRSYFPNIQQLSPLVDSINQYNIQQGNLGLKEATERKLTFSIAHTSERMKNKFNYNAEISAGTITGNFADSVIVDDIGRSNHYTVNMNGSRYVNFSAVMNKALVFNKNQLQIQLSHSATVSRNPGYINGIYNIFNTNSFDNVINLYYTVSDWWVINLKESLSFYQSRQTGAANNKFKNSVKSTMVSTSVNFTKKFSVGSNISFNSATSTGSEATNFAIWNANASYRMLTGNNLELKLAALDILHQNTNVINIGLNNSITRGTTNVLNQYFMFSVAYYPRQFGRKREKVERDKKE